jgi:hypothetical protein
MRDFDLSDILSITDGALVSTRHVEGVYDILNYMTGDNLFTHQLPRASEACQPVLLEQHPQLAGAVFPRWQFEQLRPIKELRQAFCDKWVADMKARYGETLPVAPLSEWEHKNPIEELADMIPPEKIFVVGVPDAEPQ